MLLTAEKVVPITRFNKGEAANIFNEVRTTGSKYVFKNNMPECVLISPEQYEQLMDNLIDLELYVEAMERKADATMQYYSAQEAYKMLGISDLNPDEYEVEFD